MIDFPNSPTVGDTFVAAGTTYQCTQVSPNVWLGTPASGLGIPDAPNDGVQYGRQSKAWTPIASSGGNYVLKTGDTMTGALVINQTASPYNATLTLNKAADANSVNIYAQSGGLSRWTMVLGSGGAGDFMLLPYADNGVTPNPVPFKIIRATSAVLFGDGTAAVPSFGFASDPTMGFSRLSANVMQYNSAGVPALTVFANPAANTSLYVNPRGFPTTGVGGEVILENNVYASPNRNFLRVGTGNNNYYISGGQVGSNAAMPMQISFPMGIVIPGGWLQWPALARPSTDPNTLDDYAEGTFTLTNAGIQPTVNYASYTKIGRLVYISVQLTIPANSSPANFQFNGLPFNASGAGAAGPLSIGYTTAVKANGMYTVMASGGTVNIYDGSGYATFAQFNGATIYIGGCYQAA